MEQSMRKVPLRGALFLAADSPAALTQRVEEVLAEASGRVPPTPAAPAMAELRQPERVAVDYADRDDLVEKGRKTLRALKAESPAVWKALRGQGIFRGRGVAPKVAFLYTGQGSQYVNMLATLRGVEPIVSETCTEADTVMAPILGRPLSAFVYVDQSDAQAVAKRRKTCSRRRSCSRRY